MGKNPVVKSSFCTTPDSDCDWGPSIRAAGLALP